jgi:hypothetical protein
VLKKDSSSDMKSIYQEVVLANTMKKIRNGTIKCSIKKESTKKIKRFTLNLSCKHILMWQWELVLVM